MFAARSANAYRTLSVETGVVDASPHRLIEMLLDGALDSVARARKALAERDVVARTMAITRALRIVDEGLKAALDPVAGGDVAKELDLLYAYVTSRLTEANLHADDARLVEVAGLLGGVRDAWKGIANASAVRS